MERRARLTIKQGRGGLLLREHQVAISRRDGLAGNNTRAGRRRPRSDEESQAQTEPGMPPGGRVATHLTRSWPHTPTSQIAPWPLLQPTCEARTAPPQLGASRPDGNWPSGPDPARHNLPYPSPAPEPPFSTSFCMCSPPRPQVPPLPRVLLHFGSLHPPPASLSSHVMWRTGRCAVLGVSASEARPPHGACNH